MEYFDWTSILLDLIVTVIGFLFIPVFIRLLIGKLPTKKAKRIAIINAIIVQIIFIIIIAGISDNPKFNFMPAIVWGSVGYAILNNGEFENDDKKICPHCNSKNNPKRETCFMCGKPLIITENENEQENTILSKEEINYARTILLDSKGIVNDEDVNDFIYILHTYLIAGKEKTLSDFEKFKDKLIDTYESHSVAKISFFLGVLNANHIISEDEMTNLTDKYTSEIIKNINIESKLKSIEESIDNLHSESTYTYCGKCGAKNYTEDIYCTKCGNKLNK